MENWQLGGIFSYGSGAPLSITASTLPVLLGDFPKNSGKVTFDSRGALYFEGLKQVPDPGSAVLCSNPRPEATVPRHYRANSVSWRLPILGQNYSCESRSRKTWHSWLGLDRGAVRYPAGFKFRQADKNNRKGQIFSLGVDVIDSLNHPNFDAPIWVGYQQCQFRAYSVGNRKSVVRIEYGLNF